MIMARGKLKVERVQTTYFSKEDKKVGGKRERKNVLKA